MLELVAKPDAIDGTAGEYGRAVLLNGRGRYQPALEAARRACDQVDHGLSASALAELIEAASRSGERDAATAALRRLEGLTASVRTDSALGIRAQSRALLSHGDDAEALYREALDRLRSSGVAIHLARAQLLYGEWLRREGRRVDSREQLRAAHRRFARMGAEGFAERARRELAATVETARRRTVETRDELTPQEAEIARLAGAGHTNPEIGAQLFISPRTVEWHMRKVFTKLGISSRKELQAPRADGRALDTAPDRPVRWPGEASTNPWRSLSRGASGSATVSSFTRCPSCADAMAKPPAQEPNSSVGPESRRAISSRAPARSTGPT